MNKATKTELFTAITESNLAQEISGVDSSVERAAFRSALASLVAAEQAVEAELDGEMWFQAWSEMTAAEVVAGYREAFGFSTLEVKSHAKFFTNVMEVKKARKVKKLAA